MWLHISDCYKVKINLILLNSYMKSFKPLTEIETKHFLNIIIWIKTLKTQKHIQRNLTNNTHVNEEINEIFFIYTQFSSLTAFDRKSTIIFILWAYSNVE